MMFLVRFMHVSTIHRGYSTRLISTAPKCTNRPTDCKDDVGQTVAAPAPSICVTAWRFTTDQLKVAPNEFKLDPSRP